MKTERAGHGISVGKAFQSENGQCKGSLSPMCLVLNVYSCYFKQKRKVREGDRKGVDILDPTLRLTTFPYS